MMLVGFAGLAFAARSRRVGDLVCPPASRDES
jgi:hypothetical protein